MTMTGREHAEMLAVRDRLSDRFQELAAERHQRDDLIPDGRGGHMLAWQHFEINGMAAEVNTLRAGLGKPPVSYEDIQKADQCAGGHVDYASKFPFYCAEIVYGVFPLVQS